MHKVKNSLLFLAIIGAVIGCSSHAADGPGESPAPSNRVPVDARIVRAAPFIQEEVVAGSVLSNREVTITSEISEKIEAIHFTEGHHVKQGALLFRLDDSELNARLKQIQAEVALARLNETRLSQLLKNESVRQEEYDVAVTKLRLLEASEELIQIELGKTFVRAPFSGEIGIRKVEIGSLVSPGQSLATLQDHSRVRIEFSVPEKYLGFVKAGKNISFTTDGQSERRLARVSATESNISAATRSILVHAVAPNADGKLKSGMSARVYFPTTDADAKGVSIPSEALIPGASGYAVFVVRKGTASMNPVQIGSRTESEVLITSGLNDGDTVMVSNILRSGDGTPVEIVSIK